MYFCSMYTHFTISEDEVIILLLLGLGCHSNKHFLVKKKQQQQQGITSQHVHVSAFPTI